MRLRQIEVFHAAGSNGSISAGSRALNVLQPAASAFAGHGMSGWTYAMGAAECMAQMILEGAE